MDPTYPLNPGIPGAPPTSHQTTGLTLQHVYPICSVSGWLKFLGILNIIIGAIYCITIVGAIFGWLPLWIGILSTRAGSSLREGYETSNPHAIESGLGRLGLIIKIIGVITIISLALNVIIIPMMIISIIGSTMATM